MAAEDCIPTRVCTSCNIQKPATAEFFHAYKRAPDGRRSVCRECRAKDHSDNREQRLVGRRSHYQEHRERLKAACRDYYWKNPEAQRESARNRHARNSQRNNQVTKEYYAKHRDRLNTIKREKGKAEFKAKYRVDMEFTIRHRMKALLRRSLRSGKGGKRLEEITGYSASDLRVHLERQFTKGMTWERFMAGEIHIDHIIPMSSFSADSIESEDFKACWSLSNLRPMWAEQNLKKGAKRQTLL